MRVNPISMGIFYLLMGLIFIYLATNSARNGLFSIPTILLMLFATFDIGVAIRIFLFSKKVNDKKK